MAVTRRSFLRTTCTASAAAAASRLWTPAAAFAADEATASAAGTVVTVFLRGAMDGLSAVVPYADEAYYLARPTIAVPASRVRALDDRFGLHPALVELEDLYFRGDLALVHAAGSQDDTRSHFDAQEVMERGADLSVSSGWLTRHVAATGTTALPMHSMAWGSVTPASLRGDLDALSLRSLDSFGLTVAANQLGPTTAALEALYGGDDHVLKAPGRAALRALDTVAEVRANAPAPDAVYPASHLGNALSDIARTIKSDVGLTAATVDVGGWDLHAALGTSEAGTMRDNLADLGGSLRAFSDDLGERMQRTTVLVMSEFGRRVDENGSNGVDHGSGNAMFVLGGGINGGRVYGDWQGLGDGALFRGDVPILTDYRDVVGEITSRHGSSTSAVFPDHAPTLLGLT